MENEGINTKWRVFAEKIVEGRNGTEAYLEAGFQSSSRASAQAAVSRLRRQPKVAAYIAELRDYAIEEAREDTVLHLRATLACLARIVKTSAATLEEGDELIQYSRTYKDGSTAIRMPDKLKALKMHADLCGFFDRAVRPARPVANPIQKLMEEIRAGGGNIHAPAYRSSTAPSARDPIPDGRVASTPRAGHRHRRYSTRSPRKPAKHRNHTKP